MRKWIPLVVCGAIAIAAILYAVTVRLENRQLSEAKMQLDRFCRITKWAVQEDLRDFESGDPRRQEEALNRFSSGRIMFHNDTSFRMCVDDVPTYSMWCFIGDDWSCRIALAKQVEAALKKRIPR